MQFERCPKAEVMKHVGDASALIPAMASINRDVLENATKLKFIIQFGVGLEGVDMEQVMKTTA